MNDKRLQKLEETLGLLQKAYSELESIRDAEQEDYNNMSEHMRYSEVGETYIENAENIGSVLDDMDNIIADLKDLLDNC